MLLLPLHCPGLPAAASAVLPVLRWRGPSSLPQIHRRAAPLMRARAPTQAGWSAAWQGCTPWHLQHLHTHTQDNTQLNVRQAPPRASDDRNVSYGALLVVHLEEWR